jgi:predicted nucleic acid-binding protein
MTTLFADTYYWVALADFADRPTSLDSHIRAGGVAYRYHRRSVDRILTFFSSAPESLRRQAAEGVDGLLASSVVRVIPQSRQSFLAGLQLYRARPDKGYSLVDCISMQTMRNEGLTEVLTNDRHFEQEGFLALFRDS